MADITLTAARIAPYMVERCTIVSKTAAVALTAGQAIIYDSNGKAAIADANDPDKDGCDGIVLDAVPAGSSTRVLEEGWVAGYDLSGVAYNGDIFLSDTAGAFATATSATGSGIRVGKCDWRNSAGGTFDKVLRFDRASRASRPGALTLKESRLAITGAALHAGVLNWQNFESGYIDIAKVLLVISTQSTGASTIDVGTTATSATTASDNLIDGVSGAAAGVFDNGSDAGTNGKSRQRLATGKWVTVKEASGDVTGLVATLIIQYYAE